ncbi:MAG: hypothetical protein ABIJ09_14880 [Pseudomonadota bacterium]
MGTLKAFRDYLDQRAKALRDGEKKLCALQEKYETFFAEVSRAREHELEQLRAHIVADRATLPAAFNTALDAAWHEVEAELDRTLHALEQDHQAAVEQAETLRRQSVDDETSVHKKNVALDREEENLKTRSAALLDRIDGHNQRIREMGRGFGFFKNFFAMRRLAAQRRDLDAEQAELLSRIEILRTRWQGASATFGERETKRGKAWTAQNTEAAALAAKVEHLRAQRTRLIERSALEKVLFTRQPELQPARDGDPACPRCGMRNVVTQAFCSTCAQRLKPDRSDFSGSLDEIAELNGHHAAFSEGMQACQEIIGLVRGLQSGVANFTKSVEDMIQTEKKYPLPKLVIEVPKHSLNYGRYFDSLAEQVASEQSLHPREFAKQVQHAVGKVLTEPQIKSYFETMGQELSSRANAQW